jgi:outer membrane biogenesis lipoprotein LolB
MKKLILLTATVLLTACNKSTPHITPEQFRASQALEVQHKLEYQRDHGVVMVGTIPNYTESQIEQLINNANKGG